MAWKINRPLDWLTRALLLRAGESPRELDDQPINPVLDVAQGGAAFLTWLPYVSGTLDSATDINGDLTLIEADENLVRILRASVNKVGVAAAVSFRLYQTGPAGAAGQLSLHATRSLAPATSPYQVTWQDIASGMGFWVLPPGHALRIRWDFAGVGDTLQYRLSVAEAPAGFKIW